MSTVANLETVHSRLSQIRNKIRTMFLVEGISRCVMITGALVGVTFLLDFMLNLPSGVRLLFLVASLGTIGFLFVKKVVARYVLSISDDDLALFVERNYPELQERLISAIQFSRQLGEHDRFNSPELVEAVIKDAADAADTVDFGTVVIWKNVTKVAAWAFVVFCLVAGCAIGFPEYSSIYFKRIVGKNVRWPQMIRMVVLGENWENNRTVTARGEDFVIGVKAEAVRAGARLPSKARIYYEFEAGTRYSENMITLGKSQFKNVVTQVGGPFRFRITGGDDETDWYYVSTMNPPNLESISLWFTYPKYLRLQDTPDNQPEVRGDVRAPLHTKVRFTLRANEELDQAQMLIGKGAAKQTIELRVEVDADGKDKKVLGEFEVTKDIGQYEVRLLAKNKLRNRDPLRFTVKGQVDKSPDITVNDPIGTEAISELCVRPFDLLTEDDFGIKEIGFSYKVTGHKTIDWTYVPFTAEHNDGLDYGERQIRTVYEPGLDVTKLGVKPGDFVHVRFHASDFKDLGKPNKTVSKEYRFEVIPLTELQKRLEKDIETVKGELRKTLVRQERLYDRINRFMTTKKFGEKDRLVSTEAGEIREAALEQNSITNRIETARRNIVRVRRRGIYNRVFDETAGKELINAVNELQRLIKIDELTGPSPLASAHLSESSKVRKAGNRRDLFREAQNMQTQVRVGIKEAIRYLERWSTYQEIIRMVREIWKRQADINKGIKKGPEKDK